MHIALFSPAWPPTSYPNGVVTYVHWLRQELQQQGHHVSVVTGLLDAPTENVFKVEATLLHRTRSWFSSTFGRPESPVFTWGGEIGNAIANVHRRHPIDVIEMEESFGWFADVARVTSIPTVVKLHGPAFMSIVEEELDSWFARTRIDREGLALTRAPVLISPALSTLHETAARYSLSPVAQQHVVNPLSLPDSAPLWKLEACNRRALLFVGRFDKRKGGDLVLRAFAELLIENAGLELIFVGPDAGVLDEAGTLVHFSEYAALLFPPELLPQVQFLGKQTPEQIYQLRAKAFVTLIASRWENHSYTALEAMLQGCPIVSTDAGGQKEIISDGVTGLLVASGDADDLAAKIRLLLDEPERAARLGHQAREHVLRHHSPARVVAQTLDVYRQTIALAGAGRP